MLGRYCGPGLLHILRLELVEQGPSYLVPWREWLAAWGPGAVYESLTGHSCNLLLNMLLPYWHLAFPGSCTLSTYKSVVTSQVTHVHSPMGFNVCCWRNANQDSVWGPEGVSSASHVTAWES